MSTEGKEEKKSPSSGREKFHKNGATEKGAHVHRRKRSWQKRNTKL